MKILRPVIAKTNLNRLGRYLRAPRQGARELLHHVPRGSGERDSGAPDDNRAGREHPLRERRGVVRRLPGHRQGCLRGQALQVRVIAPPLTSPWGGGNELPCRLSSEPMARDERQYYMWKIRSRRDLSGDLSDGASLGNRTFSTARENRRNISPHGNSEGIAVRTTYVNVRGTFKIHSRSAFSSLAYEPYNRAGRYNSAGLAQRGPLMNNTF